MHIRSESGSAVMGSFVAELSATCVALAVSGAILVAFGIDRNGGAAVMNAVVGTLVVAVVSRAIAPKMVRGSIEMAIPSSPGSAIEPGRKTAARGLWRATVGLAPITAAFLFIPFGGTSLGAAGQGVAAGIMLGTAGFAGFVALVLGRWERRTRQMLLRGTARWMWTDPELERRWPSGASWFAWPLLRASR